MKYSRLSASFIFIVQDTRAHSEREREVYTQNADSENFQGNNADMLLMAAATAASVFATRRVSCLVHIYWRRLAAFSMMDFFFLPTTTTTKRTRETPPTTDSRQSGDLFHLNWVCRFFHGPFNSVCRLVFSFVVLCFYLSVFANKADTPFFFF